MQQKLSPTISELSHECLRLMKNELGVFSQNQDKAVVTSLEKFLEINPDDNAIVNQFISLANTNILSNDKLKTLTKTFVAHATRIQNIQKSIKNEHYNEIDMQFIFLRLPLDIVYHAIFKNWNPSLIQDLVLVCKRFYFFIQDYKESIKNHLKKPDTSTRELIQPTKLTVPMKFTHFKSVKFFIPPSHTFLSHVIFLDKKNQKKLWIYDFDGKKEMAILEHDTAVYLVKNNAAGNFLFVVDHDYWIYVWDVPDGSLIEKYDILKGSNLRIKYYDNFEIADEIINTELEKLLHKYSIGWSQFVKRFINMKFMVNLTVRKHINNDSWEDHIIEFKFNDFNNDCRYFLTHDGSQLFILNIVSKMSVYLYQYNLQNNQVISKTLNFPFNSWAWGFLSNFNFLVTSDHRCLIFSGQGLREDYVLLYHLEKNKVIFYTAVNKEQDHQGSCLFFLPNGRIAYITSNKKIDECNNFLENPIFHVIDFSSVLPPEKKDIPFIKWHKNTTATEDVAITPSVFHQSTSLLPVKTTVPNTILPKP